jgi:hypothetical protein
VDECWRKRNRSIAAAVEDVDTNDLLDLPDVVEADLLDFPNTRLAGRSAIFSQSTLVSVLSSVHTTVLLGSPSQDLVTVIV